MMRPFLYHEDWRAIEALFDEMRVGLENETDYEHEAQNQCDIGRMFAGDEQILVPRVFDEFSTGRVLIMDFLDGHSLSDFLETNPSREVRDDFGELISRAVYRPYRRRMLYNDSHPGNFLFMDDGRLGFIDFGNVRQFTDEEWGFHWAVQELRFSDDQQAVRKRCAESAMMTVAEQASRPEVVDLIVDWLNHFSEPLTYEGKFDYANPEYPPVEES